MSIGPDNVRPQCPKCGYVPIKCAVVKCLKNVTHEAMFYFYDPNEDLPRVAHSMLVCEEHTSNSYSSSSLIWGKK